jgi:hypothetical protein
MRKLVLLLYLYLDPAMLICGAFYHCHLLEKKLGERARFGPLKQNYRRHDNGATPVNHSTRAHNLLRWPSIEILLKYYTPVSEDFVIEMEEKKGQLSRYGRGQGRDPC